MSSNVRFYKRLIVLSVKKIGDDIGINTNKIHNFYSHKNDNKNKMIASINNIPKLQI